MVAPTCPHPLPAVDDTPTPFEAWIKETGLVRPIDFKFAFCSAQEAAEACPNAAEAAGAAWLSANNTAAKLPSTWALWTQCRPGSNDRPVIKTAAIQAAPSWTGLRSKNPRRDEGPLNNIARRQAAAKDALHEALSWEGRGRLGIEWNALNKDKRDAWVNLQITRIANAEAKTIRSCLRTWQHWKSWCTMQGEDPLMSSAATPEAFLHAFVHTYYQEPGPGTKDCACYQIPPHEVDSG